MCGSSRIVLYKKGEGFEAIGTIDHLVPDAVVNISSRIICEYSEPLRLQIPKDFI